MSRRGTGRDDNNYYYDFFRRQRSISETHYPDRQNKAVEDRFVELKYPHEVVPIDDLHFYRRRALPGTFTDLRHTNFKLHDSRSEPSIPNVSEYRKNYQPLPPITRPPILRQATSLKLDQRGNPMDNFQSEASSKYIPYSTEDLRRSRQPIIKNPDQLKYSGSIDLFPEFRESGKMYDSYLPKKIIRPEPLPAEHYQNGTCPSPHKKPLSRPASQCKNRIEKCHLSMEGERNMSPEYRSKYVTLPMERSKLMPQTSHLSLQGRFHGTPAYQEHFPEYNRYSKKPSIRRPDNLHMAGSMNGKAEYSERFHQPDYSTFEKSASYRKADNLRPSGDFSKELPEYYESYKDYHITSKPEKGRCRDPYFKLTGDTDWHPEYRETYTDFPRSRPIIKRPESNIRLTNAVTASPSGRKLKAYQAAKQENSPFDSFKDYLCQPEVRKAQHYNLIRTRPPTRGSGSGGMKQKRFIDESKLPKSPQKPVIPPPEEDIITGKTPPPKPRPENPPFAFHVEDFDRKREKEAAKFGRRQHLAPDDYSEIRTRTRVIEGNPGYVQNTMKYNKNVKDSHESYENAVEKRRKAQTLSRNIDQDRAHTGSGGKRVSSRTKIRRSPSTSEERDRLGNNTRYQKEYFTTSDSLRESSEEPFKVVEKVKFLKGDSTTTSDEQFTEPRDSFRESSTTEHEQYNWQRPRELPVVHKPLRPYVDARETSSEERPFHVVGKPHPKQRTHYCPNLGHCKSQDDNNNYPHPDHSPPSRRGRSPSSPIPKEGQNKFSGVYSFVNDPNPDKTRPDSREEYRGKFSGSKGRYIDENSNIRLTGPANPHQRTYEPDAFQFTENQPKMTTRLVRGPDSLKQSGWMKSSFTDV